MQKNDFNDKISRILKKNSRYPRDAYEFISAAVNRTVTELSERRHISALELLAAIRDFAHREFGPFAREVFASWKIHQPSDIGAIVFAMVDEGALSASENDNPTDFAVEFELFAASGNAPHEAMPKYPEVPIID